MQIYGSSRQNRQKRLLLLRIVCCIKTARHVHVLSSICSILKNSGFVVGMEIDALLAVIDKVMAEKKDEADFTADMRLSYFEEKMLDTSYIQGCVTVFIRELHKLSENKDFIMRVVKKILGAGQTHSREDIYRHSKRCNHASESWSTSSRREVGTLPVHHSRCRFVCRGYMYECVSRATMC